MKLGLIATACHLLRGITRVLPAGLHPTQVNAPKRTPYGAAGDCPTKHIASLATMNLDLSHPTCRGMAPPATASATRLVAYGCCT